MITKTIGNYVNIFTSFDEPVQKDVFLIFPEWYGMDDKSDKIIDAVEEYVKGGNSIDTDTIKSFLQNNCDEYDVEVFVKSKPDNPVMYNAICYMVEDELTSEEICDYLGCTKEEIFEQCGYDLGGNDDE